MILKLKNKPNPTKVGFSNYYVTLGRIYLPNSSEFTQNTLNFYLKNYNEIMSSKKKNIINACLKNGAKLELPILKVKPKKTSNHNESWIFDFNNKQIIENVELYDFIINNQNIDTKEKVILDSILLQSFMADLILLNYQKSIKYFSNYLENKSTQSLRLNAQYSPMSEVENILHRGHIFKNQISRFLSLSSLLGYREIFDKLSSKFKLICYQEFSQLSIIGKKALTALLIKSRNEEAIFNLLNYGLKLNWDIQVEGKKNIVAFEMLYSLHWVKAIVEHKGLDIRLTNAQGENIIHLIGACALEDSSIEDSLRQKINKLNKMEKENLFFQMNNDGLTPLMKAVMFQDEKLISFIREYMNPWDKASGAPLYESAIEFLDNYLLTSKEEGAWGTLMEIFKNGFWFELSKIWNAEYSFLNLQRELTNTKQNKKTFKI